MFISDQSKPTAKIHTDAVANDVSGLDVVALSTTVIDVQLPLGPNSKEIKQRGDRFVRGGQKAVAPAPGPVAGTVVDVDVDTTCGYVSLCFSH
jgi:hypothetical protein